MEWISCTGTGYNYSYSQERSCFLKSLYFPHLCNPLPGPRCEGKYKNENQLKKENLDDMPKCWQSESQPGTPDLDILII